MFFDKNNYLKKWNVQECEDEAIKRFVKNYDVFMANIPDDIKKIIIKLLDQYEYISSAKMIEYVNTIYNKLSETIKDNNINIVVLPIIDEYKKNSLGEINSSNDMLSQLDLINKNQSIFLENSYKFLELIKDDDVIVFIDDFSGTGRTFVDLIKSIKTKISKKKIIFFVTSIMEDAKKYIANFAEQNNIDIKIFSIKEYIKAFDKFEDSDKRRNEFVNMCKLINIKKEILGYEDSESLISFYRNTPNNTIAIFRDFYIGNENIALFERKTKNRYLDKIKIGKKSRSKMNYERKRK